MANSKRILIPTDVPFWRRQDGAAQRIFELVRSLTDTGLESHIFFLGKLSADDRRAIAESALIVEEATSDQPPESWLPKLKWHVDATWNQFRKITSKKSGMPPAVHSLTLADFRWPWAIRRFGETFRRFRPEFVLVEYVKLAYLLEGLSERERQSVVCLIDTHDLLHWRCQQFREQGLTHWISITKDEEAASLALFDVVIAIQSDEAKTIREMAPAAKTIVARHSVARLVEDGLESKLTPGFVNGEAPTIGYLGSKNLSNADALRRFLEEAWPAVLSRLPAAKLVIAGSICEWLESEVELPERVDLIGRVAKLVDFYSAVDFVINPVGFGTGLKIKNCEPLAFGRPLVTTGRGWLGMDVPESTAVMVASDMAEMAERVVAMGSDREGYRERCLQAVQLARTEFSDEKAYLELWRVFQRL